MTKSKLRRVALQRRLTQPRHPELYALVTQFIAGELNESKFDRLYWEAEQRLMRSNQITEEAAPIEPVQQQK